MPTCSSGRQSRIYCVRSSEYLVEAVYIRILSGILFISFGRRNADCCQVSDTYVEDEANGNYKLVNDSYGYYTTYEGEISLDYNTLKFDESIGQIYDENSFYALSPLINQNDERYIIYKE